MGSFFLSWRGGVSQSLNVGMYFDSGDEKSGCGGKSGKSALGETSLITEKEWLNHTKFS